MALTDGVIAAYPFNGSHLDTSGHFHHFTVGVGTVVYTAGKFGQAVQTMGGSENVFKTNPFNGSVPAKGPLSISAWIRTQAGDFLWGDGTELSNPDGVVGYGWGPAENNARFLTEDIHVPELATGVHHVVVTADGLTGRLYIDSAMVGSVDISALEGELVGTLQVGASAGGAWADDLVLWDRALSPSEVAQIYNGGTGLAYPFPDPPVANFSADDATPTESQTVTFTDLSTNTPTSWAWLDNGVQFSTAQNPTRIFTVGAHTIQLTATNAGGSDAEIKTNYITASPVTPSGVFRRALWSWNRVWKWRPNVSQSLPVPTLTIPAGDDRDFGFDFSEAPEVRAGVAVSSAEVLDSPSGPTLGSPVVFSVAFDGIPAGEGVSVRISGATAGSTYNFAVRATLESGRKLTIPARLLGVANHQ